MLRFSVSCNLVVVSADTRAKKVSQLRETSLIEDMLIHVTSIKKAIHAILRWKKFKDKPVPDPAHSSVATWLSECDQKVNDWEGIRRKLSKKSILLNSSN